MLNKPAGVLSATEDRRQKTVLDLLPEGLRRRGLFPAGRLDKDTTGLLLITDDGELAHKMLSPKSHVYKQYRAQLDAPVEEADIQAFAAGVAWEGSSTPPPACGWSRTPRRLCGDPGGPVPPGQADVPGPGQDGAPAEKTQDRGPLAGQYTTGRGVQASYPQEIQAIFH